VTVLALGSFFSAQRVISFSSLEMLKEEDIEISVVNDTECNFLFHMIKKHFRLAALHDPVLLSTHVPSPSFLNDRASLMVTHYPFIFNEIVPISDHPFFSLLMLGVRIYHHGFWLINIYNLWFFCANLLNWLDVDWFVDFDRHKCFLRRWLGNLHFG
jgi:hypothetical protein